MKKSSIAIVTILALVTGISLSWIASQSQPIKLESVTWFGDQARALPDFELVDQNGKIFTRGDLQGKWQLLFFGYTHCPDICPTSLQTMADMTRAIDDSDVSNALQVLFVSVDPDRDTPEILKNYVEYFNPAFTGATGTQANLDRLTRSVGVSYFLDRQSTDQASYEVSHSTAIILLDPSVKFAGVFSSPQDSRAMASDLTKIIGHF